MNAIATYYVYLQLERQREEAARERRARPLDPGPSGLQRLRSLFGRLASQARPRAASPA